ncbi:dihydrodipicolinate reductase-like protein CRR1, chloroplastic isoform X2 [Euphorbia lathyris]
MEEPLEIPVMNDLTMVLGSISQSKETGVVIDFTDPSTVYDNVKQATAFGMKSIVYVPRIKPDTVAALSALCEKASMGSLIAPTLSIGSILLQQAAISAAFHYNNIEIVESRAQAGDLPSPDASQIAKNLSNLGQIYNKEDLSTEVLARGQVLGEDGVRVHSLVLPGLPSSTTVYFSRPGELYTIKHDITDVQCLMPGLLLAIRKVIRLKVTICMIFHLFLVLLPSARFYVKQLFAFASAAESGVWLGEVFVRNLISLISWWNLILGKPVHQLKKPNHIFLTIFEKRKAVANCAEQKRDELGRSQQLFPVNA